jgi:hypothetical protein
MEVLPNYISPIKVEEMAHSANGIDYTYSAELAVQPALGATSSQANCNPSELPSSTMPFSFFQVQHSNYASSSPQIQRLIPPSGPTSGGIEITILGSGFRQDLTLTVLFGGQPASHTQRWSDNALVCLLPAAAVAGVVPVAFEGFEANNKHSSLFTYVDENERAL